MKNLILIFLFINLTGEPEAGLPKSDNWKAFIEALIWVESRGDENAAGKHNDMGVLQITPIAVAEANRIIGWEKYKLEDRLNREKSIEIFEVIQARHNPAKDLHYALKIWNPRAPISYHRKVFEQYEK